jgi:DNA-binding MarR family transcriptional regulator
MATVVELKDQVDAVKALMQRLVQVRQIRDPLAHLHPDLTGPQIHVIACLGMARHPMAMTDLGHRICASAPTMTGIVDRLERQGLVTRLRSDDDRRVVQIGLTPLGENAFRTLEGDFQDKMSGLLSCLSPDERATFVHLIGRIVDGLVTMPSPASPADKLPASEE